MEQQPGHCVGQAVPRKDGIEKVTGRARYVDDITMPSMLHGVTVRSTVPRGRLRAIQYGDGIPWEQFTVVTAADIPGDNVIALLLNDQPCLADGAINHAQEPAVLLAHPDKNLLEAARRAVTLDVEPLPAIFSLEDSLDRKEIIWGEDNIFKSYLMNKGDVDSVWDSADYIVEGEYRTGAQEQLYIENNGMIATASPDDGVTVWGSMQCPYYVQKALIKLFGLPAAKVRVVACVTGGGFGGKEEYPSMIAGHAALLAWKSGRPVKMIYDRAEDMAATTKRHPSRTRHRTAVSRDGKLLAMDIDFALDGGAYATLSSVVLSRGTIHAAGPYSCPNVRIRARAVATNFPPHGAFRGFGAPQSIFALERHLNKVARVVGITPEELRRRNFLHQGDFTATGQLVNEAVDMNGLLDQAFAASDYRAKTAAFAQSNVGSRVKRGIGFATFMHGAGFTGSGEEYLASVVGIEATQEGRVRILVAATEMGQGSSTTLAQIAAQALDIPYDCVEVAEQDTANVPNSGPTVASRTCMIVGKLVETAALGLKAKLQGVGQASLPAAFDQEKDGRQGCLPHSHFRAACAEYIRIHGELKHSVKYEAPPGIHWDDHNYQGDAYGAYAWAVYVAEVAVDTLTYEATVTDFVALQEVGRVIHPVIAAGQIEGGVAQGVGFALYENVQWKNGQMVNNQMTNYIMPTAADVPPIRVLFAEMPYAYGPAGAKGIGELPIDGPAPAIANALENALGVPFNDIPAIPEKIMLAVQGR
jgi:CO/xanthine dehydrogenase Mo-binding subunit